MKTRKEFLSKTEKDSNSAIGVLDDSTKGYWFKNILASFIISFFAVSSLFMIFSEEKYFSAEYISSKNICFFAIDVVIFTAVLVILSTFAFSAKKVLSISLILSVTTFCLMLQKGAETNIWLNVGIAITCLVSCIWLFNRFQEPIFKKELSFKTVKIIVAVLFLIITGYMSLMGVCRYYSFTYDTFDFGIFAQMFDYMKETGLPNTTVERNMLLSHFAVHFSPFFYLLLPGYLIFSTPAYLCVMQTIFVYLGVFALLGIVKTLGFSPKQTLLACILYLTYPSLTFGLYFDFHENKFLTFFVLLTVYFLLKKRFVPFYISAFILCTIKEDAAIYLVAIALYMLISQRLIKHGCITLLCAVGYFFVAMSVKPLFGTLTDMQFVHRYSNYAIDGQSSLINIVKTIVLNFGYTMSQMFTTEKIEFILWIFLPVLFMPLFTKKVSTLVLLTPMLLINLMTNWPYQYNIDYQYTFGTAALVLFCSVLALKSMSLKQRKTLLLSAVMISVVCTMPRMIARNNSYIEGYFEKSKTYASSIKLIDDTLDKDMVIGVEGIVMPMLYDYPNLYLDPHSDELAKKVEYFVAPSNDKEDIATMESKGFRKICENGHISIFKNPDYKKID
ncbi:MAG: DUF2079 domain-containing protein [Clostridia bacterium]|nr:DUF2079 domain-containing protein [Clostridia bacterium]